LAVVEGRERMMRMLAAMAMAGMAAAGVSSGGDGSLVAAEPRLVGWDSRTGESWPLRCVLA
jgi:hypothetical protein